MRIALTILICILVSGCGLFKKTIKSVNKSEYIGKTEQFNKSKKNESEASSETYQKKETEISSERDQRNLDSQTTIEADEITIDEKGNLSAKGGVKLTNKKTDKGNSEKGSNKGVVSTKNKDAAKVTSEESKGKIRKETINKVLDKENLSEPDGSSFIWFAVAIVVGAVLLYLVWRYLVSK